MKRLERIETGIAGLDQLLEGGLLTGGVYFVQGDPGAGKTTLGNQVCFTQARRGGSAVYLTLLAESHTRMMQNMLDQSYFDASFIPDQLTYVSGYRDLEAGGLRGVISLLRGELARQKAGLAVLDGIVLPAAATADDNRGVKEFIHELQSLAGLMGCVILLLTSERQPRSNAEQTMVDGIISLEVTHHGVRAERTIEVTKFRGSRTAMGKHSFSITTDGLLIYPRLEALHLPPRARAGRSTVVPMGVPRLDKLFGLQGVPAGSITLLEGASGVGKTVLALHFLGLSTPKTPGLLLGFHESQDELAAGALQTIGLGELIKSGAVAVDWVPPGDHPLDELGHRLLERIDRDGIKRLVIDSLSGFADKTAFQERGFRFLHTLFSELRLRGVTTVVISDPSALTALAAPAVTCGLASLADQVVQMSLTEDALALRVSKARAQSVDTRTQRFRISNQGLDFAGTPG